MAMLGRNGRGCSGFGAARCGSERKANGAGDSVGQALGGFMTWPARQDVHGAWQRVQAIVDDWQHASDVF